MKYTGEQLRSQYRRLPEATQEVLWSEQTAEIIGRIAAHYALPKEQKEKLASVAGLVILQLVAPVQFAHELAVELDIPPSKAAAIAGEVEKEIFSKTGYTNQRIDTNIRTATKIDTNGVGTKPTPTFANLPTTPLTPPRSVPIRKELPPRQSSGQAPQLPTIQSLLADIKRGTAYDDRRINEAYRKTPIEVRQTLESIGFLSRLQVIAKKFALHIDETGELVSESGLVMLGLTQPTQFVENLTRRLKLPRDKTMAIGQAVNMEVFRPVREILRNMQYNLNETKKEEKIEQKIDTGYRFAPQTTQSTPTMQETKKYATDPYREPIE